MRTLEVASVMLTLSFATAAAAGEVDGSLPLSCTVTRSHDCLTGKSSCEATIPEKGAMSVIGIDFAKKQIRSPLRKALLTVHITAAHPDTLMLQGSDPFMAWSALVDKKTGALTVALADKGGTYVYFGTCKAADKM